MFSTILPPANGCALDYATDRFGPQLFVSSAMTMLLKFSLFAHSFECSTDTTEFFVRKLFVNAKYTGSPSRLMFE